MRVKAESTANGMTFFVKVVPGSSRTAVAGIWNGMLKIKVAAPPEKGKANQCLVDYLSRLFGIRKNQIAILAGTTSSVKQVRVEGVSAKTLHQIVEPSDA